MPCDRFDTCEFGIYIMPCHLLLMMPHVRKLSRFLDLVCGILNPGNSDQGIQNPITLRQYSIPYPVRRPYKEVGWVCCCFVSHLT